MIIVYLLVTVMPMIRHPLWSDLIADLTIIKYLGMASFGYALLYLPQRERGVGIFRTWQARFFVLFSLLVILLFLNGGNLTMPVEISPLASFVSFLGLFFVTLTVIDSEKRLRWVLLMAVGSVAYASLHIIREWQKYGGMATGYRPGWVTGDPNYYSVSALLSLPIALYLLKTQQARWQRAFCLVVIAITLLGMTLAASRGGLLGLATASMLAAFHSKRKLRTLLLFTVLTVPLMLCAPSSPITRLFNPTEGDQYSADHRMDLARAGLAMFTAHPIIGIGPGNFKAALEHFASLDEIHIAHNTYVGIMAEMGVLGIALYLATVIATLASLERLRQRPVDDLLKHTAAALQTGLVGFLVAAFFLSAEAHRFFWFIIFLSMVLPALAITKASARDGAMATQPQAPTATDR